MTPPQSTSTSRQLLICCALLIGFNAVFFTIFSSKAYIAKQVGISDLHYGYIQTAFNLFSLAGGVLVGRLVDTIGFKKTFLLNFCFTALYAALQYYAEASVCALLSLKRKNTQNLFQTIFSERMARDRQPVLRLANGWRVNIVMCQLLMVVRIVDWHATRSDGGRVAHKAGRRTNKRLQPHRTLLWYVRRVRRL